MAVKGHLAGSSIQEKGLLAAAAAALAAGVAAGVAGAGTGPGQQQMAVTMQTMQMQHTMRQALTSTSRQALLTSRGSCGSSMRRAQALMRVQGHQMLLRHQQQQQQLAALRMQLCTRPSSSSSSSSSSSQQ
jgi:hypothetical protein